MVEMIKIKSYNFKKIGYDKEKKILIIEWISGIKCKYFEIPEKYYIYLLQHNSPGSFMHRFIKNKFKWETIFETDEYLIN